MRRTFRALFFPIIPVVLLVSQAQAQTLSGSRASMQQQHQHALNQGYTFIKTSHNLDPLVAAGELVKVSPNRHFVLHNVSYAYARPQVKTFVERLAAQYYSACGEKMTVTSLTRPIARQPANAAPDSVHPTGMAFDLRIPSKSRCRSWLEKTLLSLEKDNLLDVTRERRPPHYHVAVFPEPYEQYLASMLGNSRDYTVRKGDTLSSIAALTGVSVAQLRATNGLRGDLLNIGQLLHIPGSTANATIDRTQVAALTEATHKVKRGETLWRIARAYGTSVEALRVENGLADDMLKIGQVLRITNQSSIAD